MFYRVNKIQNKIMILFTLLILIPIITITIYQSINFEKQMVDSFTRASNNEIKQIETGLSMYFNKVKENTQFLAESPIVKKADSTLTSYLNNPTSTKMTPSKNSGIESEIYQLYKDFALSHPEVAYTFMGTKDGRFVQYPEGNIGANFDPRERPFYKAAMQHVGKSVVNNAYYYQTDNISLIDCARTIHNEKGEVIGVQGLSFSLGEITKIVEDFKIGETGFMLLAEEDGKILAYPRNPELANENISVLQVKELNNIANIDKTVFEVNFEGKPYFVNVISSPTTKWRYIVFLQKSDLFEEITRFKVFSISIAALFIILALFATYFLSRKITRPISMTVQMLKEIAQGEADLSKRIQITSNDEAGELAKSFNAYVEKLSEQNWLKIKAAEIIDIYPLALDLQTLANRFITVISPMVGASYGVLYMKNEEQGERSFKKLAAYAYNDQEIGSDGFRFGEGLIGQCVKENRLILLNQIPDNYIKITSGLGMAKPKSIILLPVEFEGEVLAVIELASFEDFSPLQQELLKEVITDLGIFIKNITNHMEVERLLKESQALTEELQAQGEELQCQQEELRTMNEQLEEQYKNSELKAKELEKIKESLQEKTRELLRSSKYKSEFLANMSHELRTPLNSLLILAQILAENTHKNLTEKQVEYANTIFSAGKDLLNLINEILDLSKIESGKMDINVSEVLLEDVHNYIKSQFIPLARKKGIEFITRLDNDLPDTIYTDEQKLLQVLKNLLSNSFKFTEEGSVEMHIHKADQKVFEGWERDMFNEQVIAFSIIDTGIGISPEKQSIIFEAFQQADGTTSRKYGGTGLGLTISREITQLLGGFIEVNSIEGKGSTFTLYLPLYSKDSQRINNTNQAEAAVAAELIEDPLQGAESSINLTIDNDTYEQSLNQGEELLKGKKVLIIDDDMRNVFALTTALENKQMEVLFAENGREGVKLLQDNPDLDLILMDIMMPEMNGYEAMRAIRLIPDYEDLPIIALTAKAMKNDREQCIAAGASDYISKPVNLDQLFSLMRVWLYQ
ncbi:MAG: response regulator [Bacillota bacterium]|jgi:two-component system chemotaxis sensor kinase CheA